MTRLFDALRREWREAWLDEIASGSSTRREWLQAVWITLALLTLFGLYGCAV
jgi:hypothetical protein